MSKQYDYVEILDIPFINTTLNDMADRLEKHALSGEKAFVVTANPEIALHAYEDEEYGRLVKEATYVTADGIGVVKGAQMLGNPLPERVTGFDLFMKLLQSANDHGHSIYLLGAKEHVIGKTVEQIKVQFPNITIAGYHHGFFDWDSDEIPAAIKAAKPDYVFLALGFPRQEKWISQYMPQMEKGIFMGIGGSFDVLAGEVKRAPEIWQKLNLEWFYRLVKQPTRWKRMLALPRFVLKVKAQKRKQKS